ncbi:MAG: GAF domain-containing protein [Anaerolineales bacterium]
MSTREATRFLQQENQRLQQENKTLHIHVERLQHYMEVFAELYWSSQWVMTSEDPMEMLSQKLYDVIQVIDTEDGSIAQLDPETNELVFRIVYGRLQQQLTGHRISSKEGVGGWVINNGGPVIVNNPRQDWRFSSEVDTEFAFLTQSILCVPMLLGGEIYGIIELINKRDGDFEEYDATLLSLLGHIGAMALKATGASPGVIEASDDDILQLLA